MSAETTPVAEAEAGAGTKAAKEQYFISPYYLFGFIGLTFYAAWLLLQYLNPILFQSGALHTQNGMTLPYLTLLATTLLALVCGWLFSNALSTLAGRNVMLAISVLLGPLSGLSFYLPADAAVPYLLFWGLSGIAYACLLLLWTTLLITMSGERLRVFLACALMVGAAVYVFCICLIEPVAFVFFAALPVLSALCFLASFRSRSNVVGQGEATIAVAAKESDERDPVSWRLIADSLTYTPCLGIGIYYAMHALEYPYNTVCVGLASMLSCLVVVVDSYWLKWLTERIQLKLFLPLAAATVFPLSFVSGPGSYIFLFAVFLVFIISLIGNYTSAAECIRVFELSPIRVFGYGRAYCIVGVFLGYLFASVAFGEALEGAGGAGDVNGLGLGGSVGTILAFAGLIFIFIIAGTFILRDHYPTSSDVPDEDAEAVPGPVSLRDSWEQRCQQVARDYQLSPRQSEVLTLLANGRNTSYIQDSLVISRYTAKAHIYNIYQKVGIHSRQELLTLIEEIELKPAPKR